MDTDVLICGLGPVGQLLALALHQHGVKTIALEQGAEPYDLPRAAVVDDEVLRIFQSVGVDQDVLRAAQVQRSVSYVTAQGKAIEVFRPDHSELGHPALVSIHQPSLERAQVATLNQRNVDLRWNTRVQRVRQDHAGVTVTTNDGGQLSARYLVACDGGRSPIRTELGIEFGGSTFVQRWLVVDCTVDRPLAKVPHPHFVGDPKRPIVSLPMSPGRHRWEWMLHPGEEDAPFLDPARINRLIDPWRTDEEIAVERAVVYTFHARTATRWRHGRIFLAGDAAHVMPPFVGQGFSSGARDAGNLAWKLADVLNGAPDRLLDTYEQERRPHVTSMQNLAVRWGGIVQTTNPRIGAVRDAVITALQKTRALNLIREQAKPLPTCAAGAFATRPHRLPPLRATGALFPQPDRLDDKLGPGWAVVALPGHAPDFNDLPVIERDSRWLTRHKATWALLRPDRFVFACGTSADVPAAQAALNQLKGL